MKRCDLFMIDLRDVRVEKGRGLFCAVEEGTQFLLARLQLRTAFLHHVYCQRLFEIEIENPFKFAIDLLDLGLSLFD
ncbi:hypothetical protein [Agrobacterium tumefaciens]|uniref:hypothetical protein n=1 Tax=Agrobacterium tumefaciens TaxID=358 RepID=UPI001E48843C|nr:hypothetical protein [Agrobacterium tumefaciens]